MLLLWSTLIILINQLTFKKSHIMQYDPFYSISSSFHLLLLFLLVLLRRRHLRLLILLHHLHLYLLFYLHFFLYSYFVLVLFCLDICFVVAIYYRLNDFLTYPSIFDFTVFQFFSHLSLLLSFLLFIFIFIFLLQDLFNVLEPPRILLSSGCPVSKKYKISNYLDPDNNDYDENWR